jgi:hypothetical protein
MVPSEFTDWGWHWKQLAALGVPVKAGCPVGGIPWHDTHVIGAVLVQRGVAFAPRTVPSVKLPWQYEAAQPAVPALKDGAAPPVLESVPKTTELAGGFVACAESAGTTWHSAQAMGAMR